MKLKNVRIVWIDVETDGLSPAAGNSLLQVACLVTDGNLDEVAAPFEAKIAYTEDQVAMMRTNAVEFVRTMHDATDLWTRLTTEGQSLAVVDFNLHRYLRNAGVNEGKSRLGGNSITLDRNFLEAFLPRSYAHLHYRNYDMTSIAGFLELYRPDIVQFEKRKTHDALDDIRESIEEARHYREALEELNSNVGTWGSPTA